jgi:hypothetical protein
MHRRRFAGSAGALVIALLFVTAAPAGASGTDPATWAKKFCTAVANWQSDLQHEGSSIGSTTGPAEGKKVLVSFLGQAVSSTKQAISAAKKAGVPNTANGKKVADTLVKGLQSASSLFDKARAQARALPTGNVNKFKSAAKKIGTSLEKSGTALSASLRSISKFDKDGTLSAALAAEPSCSAIG